MKDYSQEMVLTDIEICSIGFLRSNKGKPNMVFSVRLEQDLHVKDWGFLLKQSVRFYRDICHLFANSKRLIQVKEKHNPVFSEGNFELDNYKSYYADLKISELCSMSVMFNESNTFLCLSVRHVDEGIFHMKNYRLNSKQCLRLWYDLSSLFEKTQSLKKCLELYEDELDVYKKIESN